MQIRLRGILVALGYSDGQMSFAGTIAEAENLLSRQKFALMLVDMGLPDGNGTDLIRRVRAADQEVPIMVISAWAGETAILAALRAGATGYLLKERDDIEITLSIRSVINGGAPIDPFVARHILELVGRSPDAAPTQSPSPAGEHAERLSPRELEILEMVERGLINREIAESLALSRLTIECHIRNIYRKLEVNSRTEAVFEARTLGLLS